MDHLQPPVGGVMTNLRQDLQQVLETLRFERQAMNAKLQQFINGGVGPGSRQFMRQRLGALDKAIETITKELSA